MIIIDDILVSEDIVEKRFVCDLTSCKGGCCVEGDAGAPLNKDELKEVKKAFKEIKGEMSAEALAEVKRVGTHTTDDDFTYVTPTVGDGICVYGYHDEQGIVKCLIEKAHREGRISFKKPITCHLFPILHTKTDEAEFLNYQPRETLCKAACTLGEKLQVPAYVFLKEPLIRKYGEGFYNALDTISKEHFNPE